jgi:hypothetical protein
MNEREIKKERESEKHGEKENFSRNVFFLDQKSDKSNRLNLSLFFMFYCQNEFYLKSFHLFSKMKQNDLTY